MASTREWTAEPIFEAETLPVRVRVQNPKDLSQVLTAQVSTINRRTFNLDSTTPQTAIQDTNLTPIASYWFDTLQTTGWRGLDGFNFKDDFPGSVVTAVEGGTRYRVQYKVTLTDGQLIVWVVLGLVQPVW